MRVLFLFCCSPAEWRSVVGDRCQFSAQADRDVGVERPPGHYGGVVQVVEAVHFLPLLGMAQKTIPALQ